MQAEEWAAGHILSTAEKRGGERESFISQHPQGNSEPSATPSSDLCRHQACARCIDMQAGKTLKHRMHVSNEIQIDLVSSPWVSWSPVDAGLFT